MTFSEFVDAILYKLYELDQAGRTQFVSIDEIGRQIKGNLPETWAFDACKVLQSRGLVQALFNSKGAFAQITGEGRLFVEEDRGHIKGIKEHGDQYFIIAHNGSQVAVAQHGSNVKQESTVAGGSTAAERLIQNIEDTIRKDQSLDAQKKEGAKSYLSVVRHEFKKAEPDRSVLAAVLEPLSKIVSIASQVANLITLING